MKVDVCFRNAGVSLCLGLAVLAMSSMAASPGPSKTKDAELVVSHEARALQPGEVALLTVRSSAPIQSIEGKAFGKTIFFFSDGDATVWKGLVGIDLDVSPKKYPVQLAITRLNGENLQTRYNLVVKDKRFPTRRITVQEEFVNPPAEELERIQREDQRVSAIFATASPQRHWEGSFLRPVPGDATSSFGVRSILNGQPRSPHSGTDFHAEAGTPVQAPNTGKVVLADNLYFSGNVVILDHGWGLYSYFAHLSRFAVSEGDSVAPGQIIGYVGATGRVTAPHLHWSLRLAGARVDPISLLAVLSDSRGN
ncbi:MAG: M23 family metallopeptidase [Acidobacteria bacterium]|nr:M23 family metallopeptidase [Acidobacteriota bacterium]